MELREIYVEDVYPDEKNPRKDFGDINALAESCMLNAINPGEPVNPIVVVADGGIYRIVDGERRYKAMVANGLKRCHAVVCGDLDEANAMVAMVATDDKRQLTEVERSRGVQQALLLGVDPERVERVGRLAKGSAAKLRRARAAVDDAGDDMTLDRMLAIAEFEEAGDAEAVERLASCRESEWQGIAQAARLAMVGRRKRETLERACEDAGICLAEKRLLNEPGWRWCEDVEDPESLADAAARMPEGYAACIFNGSWKGPIVELYKPVSDDDEKVDPEEVERSRRIEEVEAMMEAGAARRRRWFSESVDDETAFSHVKDALMIAFFDHSNNDWQDLPGDVVVKFAKDTGLHMRGGISYKARGAFAAYLYETENGEMKPSNMPQALVLGSDNNWYVEKAVEWLEWIDLCIKDGYEPDDADERLMELASALATIEEDEEWEEQE